jgi:hypothetical protein
MNKLGYLDLKSQDLMRLNIHSVMPLLNFTLVDHESLNGRDGCPKAILCFLKDQTPWTIKNFVRYLFRMSREAVHKNPSIFCSSSFSHL